MRTLLIAVIVSLSLAVLVNSNAAGEFYVYARYPVNTDAHQIFYDGFTGLPDGYLSSPNELGTQGLYVFDVDDPPGLLGLLEGNDGILYNHNGIHSLGTLCGDYIYLNSGALLGFFKPPTPLNP